jgi:hypothetical protein
MFVIVVVPKILLMPEIMVLSACPEFSRVMLPLRSWLDSFLTVKLEDNWVKADENGCPETTVNDAERSPLSDFWIMNDECKPFEDIL